MKKGLDRRRLGWQQPIQSKQIERYVYSFEELIDAIGWYSAQNEKYGITTLPECLTGFRIVIANHIALKRGIIIPSYCPGLHITGIAFSPFLPEANISTLFTNYAPIVISNLFVADSANGVFVDTFYKPASTNANYSKIVGNDVQCDKLYVHNSITTNHVVIDNNRVYEVSGTHDAPIQLRGSHCKVIHNYLEDGGGDGITLPVGQDNVISGNHLGGADITTSASSGRNTIYGNTQVGTITKHATDASGLNT